MRTLRVALHMIPLVLLIASCAKKAEVNPQRAAQTHYQLGMAYINSANYQLALAEFAKAVELNPSEPIYHDSLGMAFMFNKHLDAAIEEFKEALRLDPKYSEARFNLSSAYLLKGDLEKARATLQEVLRDPFYPTPQFAYFNLANIYEREGKVEEAIHEYKRALDIDRGYVEAHHNLGRLYLRQGKTESAIQEFSEAARLSPRIAVFHQNLGVAYMQAGKKTMARRAFEQVLELERDGPSAEYARKMLEKLKP